MIGRSPSVEVGHDDLDVLERCDALGQQRGQIRSALYREQRSADFRQRPRQLTRSRADLENAMRRIEAR
jgi:hypothetical protein